MQIGYKCDVGRARRINEDSLLCLKFDAQFGTGIHAAALFLVADGMGGHNAGEIASELGTRTVASECLKQLMASFSKTANKGDEQATLDNPQAALNNAISMANRQLFDEAKERKGLQGMGTTMVAALLMGQDLYVAHVGDTRCYIISNRETMQITRDHSQVQEMVDAGLLTPEQARKHPSRNVITRVLGYYQEVSIDNHNLKLFQGDNILLCSDGLWGVLPDQKITEVVLSAKSPEQACSELVALANQLGGPDNISVIIVRPEQLPSWHELVTADTQVKRKQK
jgi:serine/threonine protein phosphatase PrpC